MILQSMRQGSVVASAMVAATLFISSPALAEPPASGADIAGKSVYLAPRAALRYGESLLSRVYTRTALSLELKGTGRCTTFNCPVIHHGVNLYARRVRLDYAKPTGPIGIERTLRRGDEGDDVRSLQELLGRKGFQVTVDGKFGQGTEDAVMRFQRSIGLEEDGTVGPATRERLGA